MPNKKCTKSSNANTLNYFKVIFFDLSFLKINYQLKYKYLLGKTCIFGLKNYNFGNGN
jgi:hypothetical protein